MTEPEYVESLLLKIDELNAYILKTSRKDSKLESENRHLKRVIKSYKKEFGTKSKYKKVAVKSGSRRKYGN